MSNIQVLENFDCNGDVSSLGIRWEKWKRAFLIYLEASNIKKSVKKRACLLHTGGMGIQHIYYNLPGAHLDEQDETNKEKNFFEIALQRLDDYFSPKQSKVFERYIFRMMKQNENEKFEEFLLRLRHQAEKCKFPNEEENLLDQITEKCSSKELRKKILTTGDTVTLEEIVKEANALESVKRQMEKFEERNNLPDAPINLNKIVTKYNRTKSCSRCGNNRHSSEDLNCPAQGKICKKCGFKGHFYKFCKTKNMKRKSQMPFVSSPLKKPRNQQIRQVDDQKKIDYIFNLDDDVTIPCKIGGCQ